LFNFLFHFSTIYRLFRAQRWHHLDFMVPSH